MSAVVAIAVGGALGALARYGLVSWVTGRTTGVFPWGTFLVNITGAFVIGVLFSVLRHKEWGSHALHSALIVGFLGAYTTFSTLMIDSYTLSEHRAFFMAAANVLGSCSAGLVAVYLGVLAGRAI
ncbi:MAG TPA: CrcB family protein [Gaiellaceae bacterium]|nr:CrcB family protein [Gaiellaceae bacterium]